MIQKSARAKQWLYSSLLVASLATFNLGTTVHATATTTAFSKAETKVLDTSSFKGTGHIISSTSTLSEPIKKSSVFQESLSGYDTVTAVLTESEAVKIEVEAPKPAPTPEPEPVVETTTPEPVASTPSVEVAPAPASSPVVENYNQSNTYPVGQCTWGAKVLAPWVGNYWGDAGASWVYNAQAAGYATGTTPAVGAVAVWNGHVGVVTEVGDGGMIRVKESNYAGSMYVADYRGWFHGASSGIFSYIYAP